MAQISKHVNRYNYSKILIIILGLIAVFFVMVWTRAFWGSMKAYQTGEIFLKEGNYIKAITFFDRSIHWYTPFNPYVQRSAEHLWEIGKLAEKEGDIRLSLIAYRTIRRGFRAASSFYVPRESWIKKCNVKIDALLLKNEKEGVAQGDTKSSETHLFDTQKSKSPDIFWSIIVEVGFLGWIGSVIGFIMIVMRRKGESKYTFFTFIIWIAVTIIFFSMWIVGMMKS